MKKLIKFFMVVTILGAVLIKKSALSMDGDEERLFSLPINTVNKEKKTSNHSIIPPTLSISDSSTPINSLESSPIVSQKFIRAKSCKEISRRKKSKHVEETERQDNHGESYLVSLGEDESNDHNFLSASSDSSDSHSVSPSLRKFKTSSSFNLARVRDNAKEEASSNVRKSRSLPNSPPLQKFSSSSFPDVRAAPSSRKLKRMRSLSSKEAKILQLNMESPKAKNNESKNMQGDFDVKDINFILENTEEPLCNYFRSISYLIKNSDPYSGMANTLVYSYPVFTDEKKLFLCMNELKKTSPEHIQVFLEKLVLAGIPNGINNFMLAHDELNELKRGLDIPILNLPFINKFVLDPFELIDTNEGGVIDFDSQPLNLHLFFKAMRDRDIRLLRNIAPIDIKNHLENQKKTPKTIASLAHHFDRTICWIAWKIISQKEEEKRDKLIHNFLSIGHLLLEDHNFYGAMQVAIPFTKPAVARLVSEKEKKSTNWDLLFNFINPTSNYANYRKLFSQSREKGDGIPIFSVLFSDLLHAYDIYHSKPCDKRNFPAKVNSLQGIAQSLKALADCRTLPCPSAIPNEFKFVWTFKKIEDEELDVFSSLRKEWKCLEKETTPKDLIDWDFSYLTTLLRTSGCESSIEKIFTLGIHNGKDIISYMGNLSQAEKRTKLEKLDMNEKVISTILSADF